MPDRKLLILQGFSGIGGPLVTLFVTESPEECQFVGSVTRRRTRFE
jgi:hypothetical protein